MSSSQTLAFDEIKQRSYSEEIIYKNVPWFSREEWNDVYVKAFGDDFSDWKYAYDQMIVWKSRVERLSVGIESTLPLLKGKIALSDPLHDQSSLSSLLTLAVSKFVSVTLKGYENQFQIRRSNYLLAKDLNLPLYLVNLRNEIVHSDSIFGNQTLRSALKTSLDWIKTHYWDVEYERFNHEKNTFNLETLNEDREKIPFPKKDSKYFDQTLTRLKKLVGDALLNQSLDQEKKNLFKEFFQRCYKKLPHKTMEMVVLQLFYSEDLANYIKKESSPNCCCKVPLFIPLSLIRLFTSLIKYMIDNKILNHFLDVLIGFSEGKDVLCHEWLSIILNSSTSENACQAHRFPFTQSLTENSAVNWKQILLKLFSLKKEWSTSIALRFTKCNGIGITSEQRQLLINFINVYNKEVADDGDQSFIEKDEEEEENYSKINLPEDSSERNNSQNKGESGAGRICLGYLPHQKPDPYFYQKLVLNIPENKNFYSSRKKMKVL